VERGVGPSGDYSPMRRDVGFFLVFIYIYFWGLVVLIDFALAGRTGIDLLVQHSQLRGSLKSV
jgi:hypothetical protein